MRHFAFLDVEKTLLHQGRINTSLLEELKDQGVTDCYLFADVTIGHVMAFNDETQESKPKEGITSLYELVDVLKNQGFAIHGVITRADAAYYDERGLPKPVGAAYQELYEPVMRQVIGGAVIGEHHPASDPQLTADYYRNVCHWSDALHSQNEMRRRVGGGGHKEVPSSEITVFNKATREVTLIKANELADFLSEINKEQRELRELYEIRISSNSEKSLKINDVSTALPAPVSRALAQNARAFTMYHALPELYQTHGPFALTLFDDSQENLDHISTVINHAQQAGMTIGFSTSQVGATTPAERKKHRDVLTQTSKQAMRLDGVTALMNDNLVAVQKTGFRLFNTRTNAAAFIRENLALANSGQLMTIAQLALSGHERLFPNACRATALKCLFLAYLKAENPQDMSVVMQNIDELLRNGHVDLLSESDPMVNELFTSVKRYARSHAGRSDVALETLNRIIDLQKKLYDSIPVSESQLRARERFELRTWRRLLTQAGEARVAYKSTLPAQASSSSSSLSVASSSVSSSSSEPTRAASSSSSSSTPSVSLPEPGKTGGNHVKHFAFLDVDNTLLYGFNNQVNHALLDELARQGVTDIYLFTSMSIRDLRRFDPEAPDQENSEAAASRYKLIEILRDRGFTVHGVITPSDNGYYDEAGVLKPLGAPYAELYEPVMRQMIKTRKRLEQSNYSPDGSNLSMTYFRSEHHWTRAMEIEFLARRTPHGDIGTADALELCLVDRDNQAENGRFLTSDQELEDFFNNEEEKERYFVERRANPTKKSLVKGNDTGMPTDVPGISSRDRRENVKGVMWQRACDELFRQHGPFVATFFDDKNVNLISAHLANKKTQEAGLAHLETYQVNADLDQAQSHSERMAYRETISRGRQQAERMEQAINRLDDSIRILSANKAPASSKTQAAAYIRANLGNASFSQLVSIAGLASSGNNNLFPKASAVSELKCLFIACLKANSTQVDQAEWALQEFLERVGYVNPEHQGAPFVEELLNPLKAYALKDASYSRVAQDMLSRMIFVQESLLAKATFKDRGKLQITLNAWREQLARAKEPAIAYQHVEQDQAVVTQPVVEASTVSSSPAMSSSSSASDSQGFNRVKEFVFLDVDLTLLYGDEYDEETGLMGKLNIRYLQTLLDAGMTDLYLFTNMGMEDLEHAADPIPVMSRYALIQKLTEMGFTVHGVITPADNGYFSKDGKQKPIGAPYEELYKPFMDAYQELNLDRRQLERFQATKEHQLAFWSALLQWKQARAFSDGMKTEEPGKQESFTVKSMLIPHKRPYEHGPLRMQNEEQLAAFLDDEAERLNRMSNPSIESSPWLAAEQVMHKYRVTGNNAGTGYLSRPNGDTVKVAARQCVKGLMMQLAIGQLLTKHGQGISILFADDKQENLDSARLAAQDYIHAGMVSLETCLISTDYNTAVSPGQDTHYRQPIERIRQSLSQAKTILRDSLFVVANGAGSPAVQEERASAIRQHLPAADSEQLLLLSQLAVRGDNALFVKPSLKSAYECLVIAYFKASPEEQASAFQALQEFLNQHDYALFSKAQDQVPQVSELLMRLDSIACHEARGSLIAMQFLERRVQIQHELLTRLEPSSREYESEKRVLDECQGILENACRPMVTFEFNGEEVPAAEAIGSWRLPQREALLEAGRVFTKASTSTASSSSNVATLGLFGAVPKPTGVEGKSPAPDPH